MPANRPRRFTLIIGAMKSGTTSLFKLLATHPEVTRSSEEEPFYFNRPDSADGRGDDDYFALWPNWDPARQRVALEGSTSYSRLHRCDGIPERVARFGRLHDADMRMIYIVRDPIARMESHLRHVAYQAPRLVLTERDWFIRDAITTSSYAFQLEPWLERFPRERLLLLSFDDLRRDPEALLRRTCEFLDIDPSHEFLRADKARNVSHAVHPIASALTRSVSARRVLDRVPPPLRARFVSLVDRLGALRPPTLRPSERRLARELLSPEVERMAREHGLDTSGWLRE